MKINCVIVDDIPDNLKLLQQTVEDIDDVVVVKSFVDGNSFLEGIKELRFDMCILDNRLPDTNGVDIAKRLKGKKVIFVSAHEVSAYDAFDVGAVDVLKKPATKERLETAIKKCRDKIINERGYVFLKTAEGKMRFKLEDIVYITSEEDSLYKFIMTREGDEIKTMKTTLESLLQKLPKDQFCLINRSTILNINYFKSFGKDNRICLDFKDGKNKQVQFSASEKLLDNIKQLVGFVD